MLNMDEEPKDNPRPPKLLAQAQIPFSGLPSATNTLDIGNNYFKSATWTPDGTSLITNNADNHIRTFIVPPDLLEPHDQPLQLNPYSTIPSFEAVNALQCYPGYNLQDPATCLVLSTASEHPIRLNSALTGQLVLSYPLVSPTTERYIKPQSLLFTRDGSKFLAGSDSLLSIFDLSRQGEERLSSFKTGPRNSKASWSNPGTVLRGLISALDIDGQYNVLAAGTLSRQVGLYDAAGEGECIGVFTVAGTDADASISGSGITQVKWSRCGRYLYVAERKSDGVLVYDIRKTGQLLSWTTGRQAVTNQRLGVDLVVDSTSGRENIWGGGTDGMLRRWAAPHLSEGPIQPDWCSSMHPDHITSVGMHSTGSVVVTAAGSRSFSDLSADTNPLDIKLGGSRSLLKLWDV